MTFQHFLFLELELKVYDQHQIQKAITNLENLCITRSVKFIEVQMTNECIQ